MTGDADFSSLKEDQAEHTMSLSDFLKLKNEYAFNKLFKPHPGSKVLNQDFHIFECARQSLDIRETEKVERMS